MFVYLNDNVVPEKEAVVSVYDHGYLYGDGVYETMRAYSGVVFKLSRHIERLRRSASMLQLRLPSDLVITDAVHKTLESNKLSDAYIRITVSRGKGPIGLDPGLCPQPTFVVIAEQFREYPDACYTQGVKLIVANTRRNLATAINPMIKSLNFLNNILAKVEAKGKGAYEAVMLNVEGFVAEGTVCNIFFFKNDVLCTPSPAAGILDGITRELVIGLAKESGLAVDEGLWRPEDMYAASEIFITNTTSEIMPVSMLDERTYKVGERTASLRALYRKYVADYIRDSNKSS